MAVSLEPVQHLVLGDYIQPVEAHGKELGDVAMTTCKAICDWLKTGNKTEVFSEAVVSCQQIYQIISRQHIVFTTLKLSCMSVMLAMSCPNCTGTLSCHSIC